MAFPQEMFFVGDWVRFHPDFLKRYDLAGMSRRIGEERAIAHQQRMKKLMGIIGHLKYDRATRSVYAWVQWQFGLTSPWINLTCLTIVKPQPDYPVRIAEMIVVPTTLTPVQG